MTKPQYLRIKDELTRQIHAGGLHKLPSERQLCELFSTTRVTIREALAQLEASGLIYRQDRRGWFVSPPRLRLNPRVTSNFHQIVAEQGGEAKTEVLDAARQPVPPALRERLGMK
ncbi:MAG: GntR family transcriptional regulator, partial [Plesiomonas shigelloides]